MGSLYDLLMGSSRAREDERRRISATFPKMPLARGGYRPPPVTLQRPRNVPKETVTFPRRLTTQEIVDKFQAGVKAREQEQGIAPRVSTEFIGVDPLAMSRLTHQPYSGPSPIENLPLRQPNQDFGMEHMPSVVKTNLSEPPTSATTDVENSRFLRMPVSKAEFNLEPGTPTPKEKLGFLEGMDEDTRRNLMLSALTTGLKLMSSQRWSTTPQSPVADIGEAGLTGVQTYVGLASADRKYKLLEDERRRKELRDILTGQHQKTMEEFERERLGWKRPGGIEEKNILSQIASRKDTTTKEIWDEATQSYIVIEVPNALLKYMAPITKPVKGEKVVGEAGTTFESPYRIGGTPIPGKPEIRTLHGMEGEKNVSQLLRIPQGGKPAEVIKELRGTPPSEERTKQTIKKEEARRLDVAINQVRSNAATQIRIITNIDGQNILAAIGSAKPGQNTTSILANMGVKLSPAGIAKVEKIYKNLIDAEKEYNKRISPYTPGGSLLPATVPSAEDPLGLFTR